MSLFDFLYRLGPGWPTERGWYALAMFIQTTVLILLLSFDANLRADDFFKQIVGAILFTGWMGFIVQMQDRGGYDRAHSAESMALMRALVRTLTKTPAALPAPEPGDEPYPAGATGRRFDDE